MGHVVSQGHRIFEEIPVYLVHARPNFLSSPSEARRAKRELYMAKGLVNLLLQVRWDCSLWRDASLSTDMDDTCARRDDASMGEFEGLGNLLSSTRPVEEPDTGSGSRSGGNEFRHFDSKKKKICYCLVVWLSTEEAWSLITVL